MIKGIGVGIGIVALFLTGFALLTALATGPLEEPVAQVKAEAPPATVEPAPVIVEPAPADPEPAAEQLDIKDLPARIAFLNSGYGATDEDLDAYRHSVGQIAGYYPNDTPGQIREAIFRIHEAQGVFNSLTYRQSLEYLHLTVPAGFDPECPTLQSAKPVQVVADEIYDHLAAIDERPQFAEAAQRKADQARMQELIQSNIAKIRARGAAETEARARAEARNQEYLRSQWEDVLNSCNPPLRIKQTYPPW